VLYGLNTLLSNPDSIASTAWPNHGNVWLPGWLSMRSSTAPTLFWTIGPGDFWYTTHLRWYTYHGSDSGHGCFGCLWLKLMDKKDSRLLLPCDGPGRGGTCDISAGCLLPGYVLMLNWVTFTGTGSIWAFGKATSLSKSPLPTSWAGCVTTSGCILLSDQRHMPLRHEQPVRLVLMSSSTPGLGNRLHVPDLLERLLARAD